MDLKTLGRQLGAGNLSFASEDRLEKYLGLKQGSVSPFGLMNDTEHAVEFGCGCYEDSVIEQCEYSKWGEWYEEKHKIPISHIYFYIRVLSTTFTYV